VIRTISNVSCKLLMEGRTWKDFQKCSVWRRFKMPCTNSAYTSGPGKKINRERTYL